MERTYTIAMRDPFEAKAGAPTAILDRASDLHRIVAGHDVRMPDGRRRMDWFPAIFRPGAPIPRHPVFVEDYGNLEDDADCDMRALPADMAGGTYVEAIAEDPGHVAETAKAIADAFGVKAVAVEHMPDGLDAVSSFGPGARALPADEAVAAYLLP